MVESTTVYRYLIAGSARHAPPTAPKVSRVCDATKVHIKCVVADLRATVQIAGAVFLGRRMRWMYDVSLPWLTALHLG